MKPTAADLRWVLALVVACAVCSVPVGPTVCLVVLVVAARIVVGAFIDAVFPERDADDEFADRHRVGM